MDIAEYRQQSQETWERMASGWDRWNQMLAEASRPVTDHMVAALDPKPGETILELASGAGVGGFVAASLMEGEGRLIMSDFASNMVKACERRGAELGFNNVEYRVMDAESMDLDDDSVDGVLCRWAYMLMGDPAAALRETRRVLRDGGRLSFSVWAAPEDNPWASVPGRVLVQRGHMQPPESGAPGIFAMANPARIEELVKGAGFESLELREVPMSWHFESFDEFWTYTNEIAGALAAVIAELDESEQRAVRSEIEAALPGCDLPGACINVLAR
ncbi:MAG TPA: methyltransferase domain-containing protein [Thermoleophilaceae bacterium]